jgi:hypothetical protein
VLLLFFSTLHLPPPMCTTWLINPHADESAEEADHQYEAIKGEASWEMTGGLQPWVTPVRARPGGRDVHCMHWPSSCHQSGNSRPSRQAGHRSGHSLIIDASPRPANPHRRVTA